MFKEKLNDLKLMLIKKTEGNNKRNIENLVVFLILLIITVIAINTIWGENDEESEDVSNTYKQLADTDTNLDSNNIEISEYNLEKNLEDILSKIAGVGEVDVLVTYSETSEIVPMYNESSTSSSTEETDSDGGVRTIDQTDTSKEIIFEEKDGETTPITQKIIMPKVEGVIVTAEGASNPDIKTNIVQAVAAATGISSYRIQVFEMSE